MDGPLRRGAGAAGTPHAFNSSEYDEEAGDVSSGGGSGGGFDARGGTSSEGEAAVYPGAAHAARVQGRGAALRDLMAPDAGDGHGRLPPRSRAALLTVVAGCVFLLVLAAAQDVAVDAAADAAARAAAEKIMGLAPASSGALDGVAGNETPAVAAGDAAEDEQQRASEATASAAAEGSEPGSEAAVAGGSGSEEKAQRNRRSAFVLLSYLIFGGLVFGALILRIHVHRQRMAYEQRNRGGRLRAFRRGPLFGGAMGRRMRLMMADGDFDENDYDELTALDEGVASRDALTQPQVNRLPTHTFHARPGAAAPPADEEAGDTEGVRCSVCLENFVEGELIRTVPCFHQFHAACVDPWLRQRGTCPVCKSGCK